jgi:hypothetical protein
VGNANKPGYPEKRSWLQYLVRGIMGGIVAVTFTLELLGLANASNFPIYLGFYFIANGVLSFKQARLASSKASGSTLSAVISIIGGLVLVVTYPFSSYRATMVATDLGRVVFGIIIGTIGGLEVLGKLHITTEPVVKQMPCVLGGLMVLLGFLFVSFPINWVTRLVAIIWTVLVTFYMLLISKRLYNNRSHAHRTHGLKLCRRPS